MLSVYIVYRMHKIERRMVKTNAINTQGDFSFMVTSFYIQTEGSSFLQLTLNKPQILGGLKRSNGMAPFLKTKKLKLS